MWPVLFIIPQLAITARRFHDIGKNGWWGILAFISGFLAYFFLVSCLRVLHIFCFKFKKHLMVSGSVWNPLLTLLGISVSSIWIYCVSLLCRHSQPFTNRYGENPLEKSPLESKTTSGDENSK